MNHFMNNIQWIYFWKIRSSGINLIKFDRAVDTHMNIVHWTMAFLIIKFLVIPFAESDQPLKKKFLLLFHL